MEINSEECFHTTVSILQTHSEQCRQPLFFSGGKTATIPDISTCDDNAVNNILKISKSDHVTVIFTHNHCLSRIAKKMNGWRFKPDYMGTLVLHRENHNLILDGHLKPNELTQ